MFEQKQMNTVILLSLSAAYQLFIAPFPSGSQIQADYVFVPAASIIQTA